MAKSYPFTMTDLKKHAQAACNLELWTIPLYLTAAYSIQDSDNLPGIAVPEAQYAQDPRTLILSVVVQEMYHLQLACNIAASFGIVPRLDAPSYNALPYIHPRSQPLAPVRLGNVFDVIDLMVEVETPDPKRAPTKPNYDKDGNPSYKSIGDLYNVLRLAADYLQKNPVQNVQMAFAARYKINQADATDLAIHVISDQGEGAHGDPKAFLDFDVNDEPVSGSRFFADDHISHWYRFKLISDFVKTADGHKQLAPYVYTAKTDEVACGGAQRNLNVVYTKLLADLRAAWKNGNLALDAMWLISVAATQVWQCGAVPEFKDLGSVTPQQYAAVAKVLDPLYPVRPLQDPQLAKQKFYQAYPQLHACQGLNECKSMGAPLPTDPQLKATGTGPGDGYCATVAPHTCSGSNNCLNQGGCAFAPYLPGANPGGAGSGGCQTPISPDQIFDCSATPPSI
jgi:hypothetical protein